MKTIKQDNRKIAIYSRKSKFTGKGESTHNQIEACKRKIELTFENVDLENDILIYEDEGFTGYNTNRPAFQKMLKDIRDKKIKAIAFYKLDRISRNVSDFSSLVIELDNYDVSFLSATESIENVTPSGRAMMFMISVFAQLERDTIAERIRDNMLELAKNHSEITVVYDEVGSPTYTLDLARAIGELIETDFYGVYHAGVQRYHGRCSHLCVVYPVYGA